MNRFLLLLVLPLVLACRNVEVNLPIPTRLPEPDTEAAAPKMYGASAEQGVRLSVAHDATGALSEAIGGGAIIPVKLQIGPQPFVVDAGGLREGDGFLIRIVDAGTSETVYERQYSFRTRTVGAVAPTQPDWMPEQPGEYFAEMYVNGRLTDRQPFVVD